MDELVVLLVLILLIIVILPFVILSYIQGLRKNVQQLNKSIHDLEKKISLLSNAREHIPEGMTIPQEKVQVENIVNEEERPVPPVIEEIQEKSPEPAIHHEVIPEPVIQEKIYIPQYFTKEKHKIEVVKETKQPEKTKTGPSYKLPEWLSGENLLSKIGIITLVLGVAFFVKYAIDKDWINETGRVGIGLLAGSILIGVAHKLRKQYDIFASILTGGGLAIFYITITLAFREYELFSQTVAFVALILITIFSVILSLLYDKKELAIFSLLGGFVSPFLVSTGSGNYIILFTYIFILNTGMLVISYFRQWRIIGQICYILTLLLSWSWLFLSFSDEFIGATGYMFLFFMQFYLLAIIDHIKNEKHIDFKQVLLIISNNLSFFLACLYIFNEYSANIQGILTIGIAMMNAFILIILFRKSTIDKNLVYLLIAIVLTFVSLAIPIQLEGHAITMFWSLEMVILLWLWQKSSIRVFQTGFLVLSSLVLFSYFMDIAQINRYDHPAVIFNRQFITGIVVIAGFTVTNFLLKRNINNSIDKEISIIRIFKVILTGLVYLVPLLELKVQLEIQDMSGIFAFRNMILSTYTVIYVALVTFIYRKQIPSQPVYWSLFAFVGIATFVYNIITCTLRENIYLYEGYPVWYFYIHLLVIPAFGYIIFWLATNLYQLQPQKQNVWIWILVVLSIVLITFETDHLAIMLLHNSVNYHEILYDTHTFVYPVIWGLLAMILMVWGLKKKELILRKISLFFFGFIIAKFYIYDVWNMSQTGRIISFVLLGLILLLVSFLQQKIKTLVTKETVENRKIPSEEK